MPDRRKRLNPSQVNSLRALGRAFGISHKAVSKWLVKPDWPFGLRGPWNVAKVRVWRNLNLHPDRSEGYRRAGKLRLPALAAAELKIKLQIARIMEHKTQCREARLHDVAACRQRRLRQVQEVKAALADVVQRMEAEYGAKVGDLVREKVAAIAKRFEDAHLAPRKGP